MNLSKVHEDTKDLPPEFCVQNIIQQNKFKIMDFEIQTLINNKVFYFEIKIKLEEMITISHFKGVKKMLHVATLKMFSVKEQAITSKEARKHIKV